MDPVYATNAFLDGLVAVPGYLDLPVTEAAQRVQRSGFPDAYADHEPEGRAFASALTGHSPAALTCRVPMPDDEGPAVADTVPTRVQEEFGITASAADGGVLIDPAMLGEPAAAERLGWAVAQWAVATAGSTGARTVEFAGQVWHRTDGNGSAWRAAEGSGSGGVVRIS